MTETVPAPPQWQFEPPRRDPVTRFFHRVWFRSPVWAAPAAMLVCMGGAVAYTELSNPTVAGAGDAPTCLLKYTTGFVCPGRQCMEVLQNGVELKIVISAPKPEDRYVPSADRLLKSVAIAAGSRAIGVILTGMGDDGVEGARAICDVGGVVIAEAQETAVVYGMPGAVVRAGLAQKILPLPQIAEYLASLLG